MARDPVCGMTVEEERGLRSHHDGQIYYFCSDFCKNLFDRDPEKHLRLIESSATTVEQERNIAYFSMEIAVSPHVPTYSGGLGVLAGDTLRSCADLKVPVVGVTLLYEKGYFYQQLDDHGNQSELPVDWNPSDYLRRLPGTIDVRVRGATVKVAAWQYDMIGMTGYSVPVILLDTNMEENSSDDRGLTRYLYGGDEAYRFAQEMILGIGGVRM
ncbi:MAG: YHS domain-containing protein, partial [Deltaproteobacteria bacterium]|nr:YHS domain-containing protein [Deltaproteobacteria bacterium]